MIPPWAYIVTALTIAGTGFGAGWQVNGWRLNSEIQQANADALEKEKEANRLRRQLETIRAAENREIERRNEERSEVVRTLIPDIPDCGVGPDVTSVWRKTATDGLPDADSD